MDQDRFDEIAIAAAAGQSRRTALRRVFGGSLAALLAAVGLAAGDDEAAAKSCAKKCKKKNSKKARKKCRKKCQQQAPTMVQTGSATLESQSPPDCAEQGSCTDAVEGTLTGKPIAEGIFEGEFTGTNFRPGTEPNTILVDFTGTLISEETSTGDTLEVEVDLLLTQSTLTGDFEFDGTYEITGGTGRFAGATGDGEVSGTGNRELDGSAGTVDEFTLEGNIDLA